MTAEGFEADDVLATLAARTTARVPTATLSSDNDLLQLLWLPQFTVVQYGAGNLLERQAPYVLERFGVPVDSYVDYLTLVGGKNGVPGLPGVGAKGAAKLLASATLAELFENQIPPAYHAQLSLAHELHTLRTDVPIAAIDPKVCRLDAVGQLFGNPR